MLMGAWRYICIRAATASCQLAPSKINFMTKMVKLRNTAVALVSSPYITLLYGVSWTVYCLAASTFVLVAAEAEAGSCHKLMVLSGSGFSGTMLTAGLCQAAPATEQGCCSMG